MADKNGQPFFWLGDTAWLLFQRLSLEEAEVYLKNRAEKGFTVIQAVILHRPADSNAYGEYALTDASITKTFIDASPDVQTLHSYWNHIDQVIDMAAALGLQMGLLPAWGSVLDNGCLNSVNVAEYGTWLGQKFKERNLTK